MLLQSTTLKYKNLTSCVKILVSGLSRISSSWSSVTSRLAGGRGGGSIQCHTHNQHTVCTQYRMDLFAVLNFCSFCGSTAIRESLVPRKFRPALSGQRIVHFDEQWRHNSTKWLPWRSEHRCGVASNRLCSDYSVAAWNPPLCRCRINLTMTNLHRHNNLQYMPDGTC